MNPSFGTNLKKFLFSNITDNNLENLKSNILNSIYTYIPEITVIEIVINPDADYNLMELSINYVLNISNTPDQVTVQFQ
jgi:phage baseplate assembly protein W